MLKHKALNDGVAQTMGTWTFDVAYRVASLPEPPTKMHFQRLRPVQWGP